MTASFHCCDFSLAPDEDGKPMELQQDGPVLLKSEFQ